MKKNNLILTVGLFALSIPAFACSFVQLGDSGNYAGAQNFDFPPQVSAGVIVNKRNVAKTDGTFQGAPAAAKPAQWVSKYGSITFGFGREIPVTGVNEVGLRVYRFLFSQAKYPAPDSRPAIDETLYVQYLLDTASTVAEVIQQTNAVQIYADASPTHFAVCDKNADCVMIEALNGQLKIFSGAEVKVPVMTNTDYATSLQLLSECKTATCSAITDNSGWRFVDAALQVLSFNSGDFMNGTFNILTSVKQTSAQISTLWTLLTSQSSAGFTFYVKNTKSSQVVLTQDMTKLDFSCKTPVQVALLNPDDSTAATLTDYSTSFQTTLTNVLVKYLGVSAANAQKELQYPDKLTRCTE